MSDNGERFPVLSVHLSRVLDDIISFTLQKVPGAS